MIMSTDTGYLPRLESRAKYVDHLEGFTTAETGEPNGGRPKRTRIKTYMLETAPPGAFPRAGAGRPKGGPPKPPPNKTQHA